VDGIDSAQIERASGSNVDHGELLRRLVAMLDRPLASGWCVFGWAVASIVFIGLVAILRGPSKVDSIESVYSTWAVANGHLACAYPPGSPYH
jgi:hypothetical protein